jgi:hypothetical protein
MKEVCSTGVVVVVVHMSVCVCVCIVSDVIIVHTNCIEMSSFLYTPKKLATTQKKT